MSWRCGTLFSLLSCEDIYITGTVFYHTGRIRLLLYAPHTCQNFQSLYTLVGHLYFFLVCCMWWLPKPANLSFPSYTWYCTLGTGYKHSRFLHFCDWNNKFVLFPSTWIAAHLLQPPMSGLSSFSCELGSDLVASCLYSGYWCVILAWKGLQE